MSNRFRQLEKFADKLHEIVTWQSVRGLGQLKILSRVSYAMLVIVPIVASMWPEIRLAASAVSRQIEHTRVEALNSTNRLKSALDEDSTSSSLSAAKNNTPELRSNNALETRIDSTEDFRIRPLSPRMPLSWVFAFFAALFVVLAHALYEIGTPEAVKKYSLEKYAKSKRDEYIRLPSDAALRVAETLVDKQNHYEAFRLEGIFKDIAKGSEPDYFKLRIMIAELSPAARVLLLDFINKKFPDPVEAFDIYIKEIQVHIARDTDNPSPQPDINIDTIERAYKREYQELSRTKPTMIMWTMTLYLLAVALVAIIILRQCISVLEAAS